MDNYQEMDSFEVLHLEEEASDKEIKDALKAHVELFCGEDGNKTDKNGEYLYTIYCYHAKKLLNKDEKEKLIQKRHKEKSKLLPVPKIKNELAVSSISVEKQRHVLTSINQEFFKQQLNLSSENKKKKKIFSFKRKSCFNDKKVKLDDMYVVIGADKSLFFALEEWPEEEHYPEDNITGERKSDTKVTHTSLRDYFTGQNLLGFNYPWYECPWVDCQIFKVSGVYSVAILASKVIPISLIQNQTIKESQLRIMYDVIRKYLEADGEFISSMFENVDSEKVYQRMR